MLGILIENNTVSIYKKVCELNYLMLLIANFI